MKRPSLSARLALVASTIALPVLASSCSGDGFGQVRGGRRLVVEFVDPNVAVGSRTAGLPLSVDTPTTFAVRIRALRVDGSPDVDFNRFVRMSSKPGAIEPLTDEGTEGRNVLLQNGESGTVNVRITNAFGTSYILADDLGYVPVDPLRDPPPACANGIDDDGDGAIDFPADEGCAFANDDAEEGGTFAQGASPPIFISLPRIADVRGLRCEDGAGCSSSGETPYPKQAVLVDTGYHPRVDADGNTTYAYDFSTIVTRIASNGFYVSDISDTSRLPPIPTGFNNLFVFNFSAPPQMRVCDRLRTFGGTASEFFGFTQMSYPTWTLEEWDPKARPCMVPAPTRFNPGDITDKANLLRLSGSLVRVETLEGEREAHVSIHFGPDDMPRASTGAFTPTDNATNCDLNKDGSVDFNNVGDCTTNDQCPSNVCSNGTCAGIEALCSSACTADPECTEYSNFSARSTFRIAVSVNGGGVAAIQADGTAAGFNPLAYKGVPIRSFDGVMTYFSGGSQYTIEARCEDDVVLDMSKAPLGIDDRKDLSLAPPKIACVVPRTFSEFNP